MIYPGTDLKFRVTATQQDFQLTEDKFEIIVIDPYGRNRRIGKDDCFWDSDGRYYFTLERVLRGTYYACFRGSYEDDDYDKQERVFTDSQLLCVVGGGACCRATATDQTGCRCKHVVQYEQVWTVSIDGDDYLCGSDGKYILTSDGKRIAFKNPKRKEIEDMGKVILDTMTGDEFKQFIEGHKPNGEIDTLPEMMDAARGISDDETIQHDVDERIEDHDQENEASDEDIDSIFDDEDSGASTQPTTPTQPMVVEEEEEP